MMPRPSASNTAATACCRLSVAETRAVRDLWRFSPCPRVPRVMHDRRVLALLVAVIMSAPRSPWQNPFVERLIGSIRRECLDHVIVLGERHLRGILASYFAYYHRSRTHLSLVKDAPNPRAVTPPQAGVVIELPEVGGLHHRYERRTA